MAVNSIDLNQNLAYVDTKMMLGQLTGTSEQHEIGTTGKSDGPVDKVYKYEQGEIWARDNIIRVVVANGCNSSATPSSFRIPGQVIFAASSGNNLGQFLGTDVGAGHVYFHLSTGTVWTSNDPSLHETPSFSADNNAGFCPAISAVAI